MSGGPYRTAARPEPERPSRWQRFRQWWCERFDGGHLIDFDFDGDGTRHWGFCWKCGMQCECPYCPPARERTHFIDPFFAHPDEGGTG